MVRKLVKSAILGTCLMATVTAANAAEYNVNIYGASAQYKFWTSAAPEFLESQGCDAADVRVAKGKIDGKNHGIAWCAGTVGVNGVTGDGINGDGNDYFIRYSDNASYDGVMAVQDNNDFAPSADVAAGCGLGERLMADETNTTWGTMAAYGAVGGTDCKDVVIGASDVAAETFNQQSSGDLLGPAGGAPTTRDISGFTIDLDDYYAYRPIVVPFGFFANDNASTPVPFNNMTRLMATSIFSGQITNWNQFDASLASMPMVVCLRHAGSGTHATLDAAVMRGDKNLLTQEVKPGTFPVLFGLSPVVWFNSGSSDEMNCISTSVGAVGYADADASAAGVKALDWMGVPAEKSNITHGQYDFWSNQWLYSSKSEPTAIADMVAALNTYASNGDNMPADHADYWASESEMKVKKATDKSYPSFK
ncbi:MAG: substrate-binding domain-containing protein [Proteobacteria bacterium]|nr:substrate-binding domain-containing protein [Pseudomonadota bacterium]